MSCIPVQRRRTRRSIDPAAAVDDDENVTPYTKIRRAMLVFMEGAAASINDVFWFPVQGDCEISLCLLSMLEPIDYACVLLMTKLVQIRSKIVTTNPDRWSDLLGEANLRTKHLDGRDGKDVAEATVIWPYVDLFRRLPEGVKASEKKAKLVVIRLGKDEDGTRSRASLQLTSKVERPGFNRSMRLVGLQRQFRIDVMPHVKEFKRNPENKDIIKLVLEWVLHTDLEEDGVRYDSDSEVESSDGSESDESQSDDDESDDDESDDDEPDDDEPGKQCDGRLAIDGKGEDSSARKPSGEVNDDSKANGDKGRRDKQSEDGSKLARDRIDIAKATQQFVSTLQSKGIEIEIEDIARLIDERSREAYGDGVDKMQKQAASSVADRARADTAEGQSSVALDSEDSTLEAAAESSEMSANREGNTLYDSSHVNATFSMLNSLPQQYNVMNKEGSVVNSFYASIMLGNLVKEALDFASLHNEPVTFYEGNSKNRYHVIRVPVKTKDKYVKKAKRSRWIEEMLEASVKVGSDKDAITEGLKCLLEYLLKRQRIKTLDILLEMGVIPSLMNEYQMAATMKTARMGITNFRLFVQCYKSFCSSRGFCTSENKWRQLSGGIGEIKSGIFLYCKDGEASGKKPQRVQWWAIDPVEELEYQLACFANQTPNFDPNVIVTVQSIYTGDHGIGKGRWGFKVLVRWKGEKDGKVLRWKRICRLAEHNCTKDDAKVFKGTIHKVLQEGINRIEHGKLKFVRVADENGASRWSCELIDPDHQDFEKTVDESVIGVTPYFIGDLKLLAMLLGKEDFETFWCILCRYCMHDWQEKSPGEEKLWTLADLIKKAAENLKGKAREGVREAPHFDVPVERFILPLLHILIGLGNQVLKCFIDWVEAEIQHLPPKEQRAIREHAAAVKEHLEAQRRREAWDSTEKEVEATSRGKGLLKYAEKQVKVLPDQIDSAWAEYSDYIKDNDHNRDSAKCMHEHHDFLLLSLQECKDTVEELTKERSEMTAEVKKLLDAVSKKKKHLAKFRTDRRSEKESLYCKIDMILGEYDILRAEYHGGDLTGGHVKILMKKASQIMEQIAACLDKYKSDRCELSKEEIEAKCGEFSKLLTSWNAVLSEVHKVEPEEEDFVRSAKLVGIALKLHRGMGLSITPKGHDVEDHLVKQMRAVPGGLFDFDESWGEQLHQSGSSNDQRLRNQKSEAKKAVSLLATDRRNNLTETQSACEKVKADHTGSKRAATLEKEVETKRVKKETIDGLLEEEDSNNT